MKSRLIVPSLLAVAVMTLASATNAQAFELLDRVMNMGHGCCTSSCDATCGCEPQCGCEPSCGCDNGCNAGCHAGPACGCEPSCGCDG